MPLENSVTLRNDQTFLRADLPVLALDRFREEVIRSVAQGGRIAALWAQPQGDVTFQITAVIAFDAEAVLRVLAATTPSEYASLTPACPQAHWFEREMWEQHGLVPVGHPWLKPVRFQPGQGRQDPARGSPAQAVACGVADFFQMAGDEVHEVAVGPVHAGIIEPGHFRFQCQGETVFHLEISLGYQHRGVERALVGGPNLVRCITSRRSPATRRSRTPLLIVGRSSRLLTRDCRRAPR